MRTFDPLTIPLEGRQLIEASAGTGKTYSIALLYLRLLVEGGLDVDNIIVVTFTKSATEELRQRIRVRLREALDVLEMGEQGTARCGDRLLADFLASIADPLGAKQKLGDSLVRMDESAIFTIHGFCQRMLQEHAFESGVPFDTDFIESEQQLRHEIIRDFWRQRFYAAPAPEAGWAAATWENPKGLAAVLHPLVTKQEFHCQPEVTDERVEHLRGECDKSLRAAAESWKGCRDEIVSILLNDPCLSRNKSSGYGPERVDLAVGGMDELAAMVSVPWVLPAGVDLLATSVMRTRLKGKKILPAHLFFQLFDSFFAVNRELVRIGRIHVLLSAYRFLSRELEIRKRDRSQMYFNDLLVWMDRALAGPGGKRLARRIRDNYTAALVDEFQDTDPLQYRIFHCLFGTGAKPGLFMIGDPKQSIYSFRGADVFAYIRAKKQTGETSSYTMDTNYRSTSAMVKAVNRLFNREASFVFADAIGFSPVRAGGMADAEPFVVEGAAPAPLQVLFLTVEECATAGQHRISKSNAESAAARWTALEIARLLYLGGKGEARIGNRPLAGGDLAVLVRTHREAEMVKRELAGMRIASVYYSQDSVFSTDEAADLQLVLSAILDLSNVPLVNRALATGLFGRDAHDLERQHADPAEWDEVNAILEEYHLCWRSQGVAAMLQKLLAGQKVVQRLLSQTGGERKLTNYLHLAELLQEAADRMIGMEGLVRWLSQQRQNPEETGESLQLRLESDENLVRIVTVHKAKGLEYPIVFLPFIWSCRTRKPGEILSFHRPDTLEQVVDLGTGEEEHLSLSERERLAEDLRLLYVGFTRARYCCYFSWGRINDLSNTALAWLLHRREKDDDWQRGDLSEEAIGRDLADLNEPEKLLSYVACPSGPGKQPRAGDAPAGTLRARSFQGRIDTGWTISSYSRLVRASVSATSAGEVEFTPALPAGALTGRSVFTFPRGAAAGTCLHNIFELIDFSAYSEAGLGAVVTEQLRVSGFDTDWAPLVCRWVGDVLQTCLNPDAGLRLQGLEKNDRLTELGFYFAMRGFDLSRMNQVLADFGFARVEAKGEALTGLMRGYIDLVFRHRGRYFLADYKSNYLGPGYEDYSDSALDPAMREHRYDLQYLIYTVALHRYLGSRIHGYEYSMHFGGVYYLFLRGMRPAHPPGCGIFYTMPPGELIDRLDACFGRMEEQ